MESPIKETKDGTKGGIMIRRKTTMKQLQHVIDNLEPEDEDDCMDEEDFEEIDDYEPCWDEYNDEAPDDYDY